MPYLFVINQLLHAGHSHPLPPHDAASGSWRNSRRAVFTFLDANSAKGNNALLENGPS